MFFLADDDAVECDRGSSGNDDGNVSGFRGGGSRSRLGSGRSCGLGGGSDRNGHDLGAEGDVVELADSALGLKRGLVVVNDTGGSVLHIVDLPVDTDLTAGLDLVAVIGDLELNTVAGGSLLEAPRVEAVLVETVILGRGVVVGRLAAEVDAVLVTVLAVVVEIEEELDGVDGPRRCLVFKK